MKKIDISWEKLETKTWFKIVDWLFPFVFWAGWTYITGTYWAAPY